MGDSSGGKCGTGDTVLLLPERSVLESTGKRDAVLYHGRGAYVYQRQRDLNPGGWLGSVDCSMPDGNRIVFFDVYVACLVRKKKGRRRE